MISKLTKFIGTVVVVEMVAFLSDNHPIAPFHPTIEACLFMATVFQSN